jgi:hypothetical protein
VQFVGHDKIKFSWKGYMSKGYVVVVLVVVLVVVVVVVVVVVGKDICHSFDSYHRFLWLQSVLGQIGHQTPEI